MKCAIPPASKLLIALLLSAFAFESVLAQTDTSFWFAAPEVTDTHGDRPVFLRILTYDEAISCVVDMPAEPAFLPMVYNFAANSANLIDVTNFIDLYENTIPDSPQNKGLRITTSGPVSAMYEIKNLANPDIFVLKGRNALGTQFFTPFQTDALNGGGFAYSSFDIVATEDNTLITITPSNDIVGHPANVPFSITLQKGQTYSARAMGINANQHLNGSRIIASKPVAVTIKDDTMIGTAWGFCADLGGDQIVPIQHINTEYILIKGFLNIKDKAYVIAAYDNTEIFMDGNPVPVSTLQSGQTYSADILQDYTYIRASKPVYVMHLTGFGCEMSCTTLPALKGSCEQRIAFTRFFDENYYALIVTRAGNENAFKLNGNSGVITGAMFSAVTGTNGAWMAARINLSALVTSESYNVLTNDNGDFIMGIMNGGLNRSNYGYVTNYSQIDLGPDILKCANVPAILDPGPRNQYLWSTGDTTQQLHVYAAGTYWVEVTTNDCVLYDTITIQNKPDLSFELGPDTSYCSNDAFPLQVNPVYTSYLWNTGSNNPAIIATGTGKYWLRTTDNVGCTYTDTLTLHINNFRVPAGDTVCYGDSIQLQSSAALGWAWSPPALLSDPAVQNPKVSPPVSTMFYVQASFPGNTPADPQLMCYDSSYILVVHHVEDNLKDSIVCFSPGIALNTPPGYETFLWSTGAVSPSITAGSTGLYWVRMTDSLGCSATDSANFIIIPDLNLTLTAGKNPLCIGESTQLTIQSSYPTASYLWNTLETSSSITVQPNSTSLYQVVADQNGCRDSLELNLIVNPLPLIDILASNDSICLNDSILLLADGGTSYQWATPVQNTLSTNWVHPGTTTVYTLTGTDNNGCSNTASFTLNIVPLPAILATLSTDTICEGETIDFQASGGQSYFWIPLGVDQASFSMIPTSSMEGILIGNNSFGCVNSDTFHIEVKPVPDISISTLNDTICLNDSTNLVAHSSIVNTSFYWSTTSTNASIYVSPSVPTKYVLSGTFNGCHSADSIMIGVNPLPNVQINSPSQAICEGQSAGFTASGGISWIWQPGGYTGSTLNLQPASSVTGYVKGTDIKGCSDTANFQLTVKPVPWISLNPTADTTCSGDTITLQCSSAVPGALFTWNIPATGNSVQVHPLNTTVYSVQSQLNGCSDNKTLEVFVNSLPSTQILVGNDSICYGDSILLQGSGAFSYAWAPPINSTQANIWVKPGVTTTYTLTGISAKNCRKNKSQTITVVPLPPLTASVNPDTICPGEMVNFQASGANSYLWLPYSTNASTFQLSPSSSVNVYLSGYNTFGCIKKDTFHIHVKPVPQVSISAMNDSICRKDTMQLNAQSNLPGTSFLWSTSATGSSINVYPNNTTYYTVTGKKDNCTAQAGFTLTVMPLPTVNGYANPDSVCAGANVNLSANGALSYIWTPGNYPTAGVLVNPTITTDYIVTGTYIFGCKNRDTVRVLVSPPPDLTVSAVPASVCAGTSVQFGVGSNLPSITYHWFNAGTGNTLNYTPAASGYYLITATYNGCSTKDSVYVTVNSQPNITLSYSDDTLCQYDTVFLSGSGALSYEWQPLNQIVQNTYDIPLSSTWYFLTGTDNNNCIDRDSVYIFVYPPVNMTITVSDDTLCLGDSIQLTSTGVVNSTWYPFNVSGNPVYVSPAFSMPVNLIGTDANGCSGGDFIDIVVKPTPQLTIVTSADSVCKGDSVMLYVTSDMSGLPFTWSTGITADTIYENPVAATLYAVSCTFDGCTGKDSLTIGVSNPPVISITPLNPAICEGDSIMLYCTSSSSLTSYQWSTGSLADSTEVQPLLTTMYYLNTQTGICRVNDSVQVMVHVYPSFTFDPEDPWLCHGDSIIVTAATDPALSPMTWYDGNTSPGRYFKPAETAWYPISANNHSCITQDSVRVRVNYHPQISLGADRTLCNGNEIELNVKGTADTWLWSNGATTAFTTVSEPGIYSIIAILDSCIATDTMVIVSCSEIWIPNAFTPDGDGFNDYFFPKCTNIEEFHMTLFDRWGTQVFETRDWTEGWDGRFNGEYAPVGVYTYLIEFREIRDYVVPALQQRKGYFVLVR